MNARARATPSSRAVTSARRVVAGEQVDALLDALASGSTAEPGSGAYAAFSAAAGAALITSVAQRTLRRLDADDEPTAAWRRSPTRPTRPVRCSSPWPTATPRSIRSSRSPPGCRRSPTRSGPPGSSRSNPVLEDAVNVQLDLARPSVLLTGLAEEAAVASDPNAAGDGLAAAAALHAAALAALANVRLNAFRDH